MKPELFLSLKGYNKKTFSSDLMSGLLVAIVALPLSIAFGIQSGLTLQQGLITAIVAGFAISFFGGSKFQIGGPTVTFVALIFGYIADPSIGVFGMQMAVVMAGLILLFMGIFRFGSVVKYIPVPVIVGFTCANGIMLLVGQLKDFFSIVLPENTKVEVIPKLIALIENIGTTSIAVLIAGILTLVLMAWLGKINKKMPYVFIALLIVTVLVAVFNIIAPENLQIATIGSKYGSVKAELIMPDFSKFGNINFAKLIVPALTIAILATMEGLLSATVADGMTDTKHNSNQELVGLGIANVFSALMGGLPATGVLARTATNINSGGKTPIAGIVHSFVILIMFLLLMPLVQFIPLTALAAILIMVSWRLINATLLRKLIVFNLRDSAVLAVTLIICLVFNLLTGVLVGVGLRLVITLIRTKHERYKLKKINEDDAIIDAEHPRMYKVKGYLNYVNIVSFMSELEKNLTESCLVIDMDEVGDMDMTSAEQLNKFIDKMQKNDKKIELRNQHSKVQKVMKRSSLALHPEKDKKRKPKH